MNPAETLRGLLGAVELPWVDDGDGLIGHPNEYMPLAAVERKADVALVLALVNAAPAIVALLEACERRIELDDAGYVTRLHVGFRDAYAGVSEALGNLEGANDE